MKYALVTGGSRGIGRAICIKLAQDLDYKILINYNSNESAANETLNLVQQNGGQGEIIKFNVANANEVKQVLENWQNENEDAVIEVIVNNAGITKDGLFMWMPLEDWHSVIDTSLNGFFNVTNTLIQKLLRNRYGRIINMVSVSGVKGTAAQEVAKRKITVNAVAPGFIKTDMTENLDESELKKLIPVNRFGEAEEVADLVSFLASKKSSYITGEVININGGIYS